MSNSTWDSIVTYCTVVIVGAMESLQGAFAVAGDWEWMKIGGAVLLIARLVSDVPPALVYIKQKLRSWLE